jgi:hypothetical protein
MLDVGASGLGTSFWLTADGFYRWHIECALVEFARQNALALGVFWVLFSQHPNHSW